MSRARALAGPVRWRRCRAPEPSWSRTAWWGATCPAATSPALHVRRTRRGSHRRRFGHGDPLRPDPAAGGGGVASASPLTAALGAGMSRQLLQSSRGALLMAGVNVGAQFARRGGLPGGVVLMQEGDPGGSPFYLAQCGGQGSVEFHGQRGGGGNRYRRGERSSEIPNRRGSVLSKQAHPFVRGVVLVSRLIMPGGRCRKNPMSGSSVQPRSGWTSTGGNPLRDGPAIQSDQRLPDGTVVPGHRLRLVDGQPEPGLGRAVHPGSAGAPGTARDRQFPACLAGHPGILGDHLPLAVQAVRLLHSDPEIGLAYDDSPLFSEREVNRGSFEKTLLFSRRAFLFAGFCALGVFSLWLQLAG